MSTSDEPIVYDYAEPIVAYRLWHPATLSATPALRSVHFDDRWRREMTANPCQLRVRVAGTGHTPPPFAHYGPVQCDGPPCNRLKAGSANFLGSSSHGCGIYAFKTIEQALLQADPGQVIGRILMAGRIFEHDDGWRSEKARIDGLYDWSAFAPYRRYLAQWEKFFSNEHVDRDIVRRHAKFYDVPIIDLDKAQSAAVNREAQKVWVAARIQDHMRNRPQTTGKSPGEWRFEVARDHFRRMGYQNMLRSGFKSTDEARKLMGFLPGTS